MPKKKRHIPVSNMANELGTGIAIERVSFNDLQLLDDNGSHRHDGHAFFLLEAGTITVEIDFSNHHIVAPAIIYIHPDQVHRTILASNIIVSSWAITDEFLNPEYQTLLKNITPAKAISLQPDALSILSAAISAIIDLTKLNTGKLYRQIIKESCNMLVAIALSQYITSIEPPESNTRFEVITKNFRTVLDQNYRSFKRPSQYAKALNISTAYLNECVKNSTGNPVSYHIQQRVVLEAKRLLYYTDMSVKEISAHLGYLDYPYFSRLFTKINGATAITFQKQNRV